MKLHLTFEVDLTGSITKEEEVDAWLTKSLIINSDSWAFITDNLGDEISEEKTKLISFTILPYDSD